MKIDIRIYESNSNNNNILLFFNNLNLKHLKNRKI